MHSGHLPGQPGRRGRHVCLEPGQADLDAVRVLAVEPAHPDRGEHEFRQLRPQHADLRHVPERPVQHRGVDQTANGWATGRLRSRGHAVQRQWLQRRRQPSNAACAASSPSYNAETITCGAEIGLYMWQQYQATGDTAMLAKYFPFMKATAQFLLAYQQVGSDGLAARGRQRPRDPVGCPGPDHRHRRRPGAVLRHGDRGDAAQHRLRAGLRLSTALGQIRPYGRTDQATHSQLLGPSADVSGTDVIGNSYQPTAAIHNTENLGLEPVVALRRDLRRHRGQRDNLTALACRDAPTVNGSTSKTIRTGPTTRCRPLRSRLSSRGRQRPGEQRRRPTSCTRPAWPRGTPARWTSPTSSTSPTSPPRWTKPWPPTTTGPCALGLIPGRRAGTCPARCMSRAVRRSTYRSRAETLPRPRSEAGSTQTMSVRNPVAGPASRGGRRLDRCRCGLPDHRLDSRRAG